MHKRYLDELHMKINGKGPLKFKGERFLHCLRSMLPLLFRTVSFLLPFFLSRIFCFPFNLEQQLKMSAVLRSLAM
jgi:hypothetical protein